MRKAAEIPEGKGDRGGRVLAEARHRHRQPTHPSPPSKPRAQSSGEHKQAGRQQQRPRELIAECPVHAKRGNGGGGGRGEARRFDGLPVVVNLSASSG